MIEASVESPGISDIAEQNTCPDVPGEALVLVNAATTHRAEKPTADRSLGLKHVSRYVPVHIAAGIRRQSGGDVSE